MTLEISRIGIVMAILALMVAILMSDKRRERPASRPVQARRTDDAARKAAERFAQMKQARQEANYQTYKAHGGSK